MLLIAKALFSGYLSGRKDMPIETVKQTKALDATLKTSGRQKVLFGTTER
jgi:hypothetical protein